MQPRETAPSPTRTVLLDIEGTTTPLNFVHEVLFPYARKGMEQFLIQHGDEPEIRVALDSLESENLADVPQGAPVMMNSRDVDGLRSAARYCLWLMNADRKSTGLKTIQGRIWEQGFRVRALRGEVFADVPAAFKRWREQCLNIAIYSSGSVLSQQLLFGYSEYGDLTRYIGFFFDTNIGPKRAEESYRRIAERLECRAEEIVFVSDVYEEIKAAAKARLTTALSIRPGNHPSNTAGIPCQIIRSFDELLV